MCVSSHASALICKLESFKYENGLNSSSALLKETIFIYRLPVNLTLEECFVYVFVYKHLPFERTQVNAVSALILRVITVPSAYRCMLFSDAIKMEPKSV